MSQDLQIVGIGEILWDVFPDGARFGGAPANFACHAAALAGTATIVSAVGRDRLGDDALAALAAKQVHVDHVARVADWPTGTVTVRIDAAGHASYEFGRDEAWDHLDWTADLAKLAGQSTAVCFGTLGQRSAASRETIRRVVAATPESALRICDINLRAPFFDDEVIRGSIAACNVLKLNDDELPRVAKICGVPGSGAEALGALAERFSLRAAALTCGAEGAILVRGREVSHRPGVATTVRDTVGAGDAFTAALTLGLLAGDELDAINDRSCRIAAFVCSQSGATPPLPSELRALFAR